MPADPKQQSPDQTVSKMPGTTQQLSSASPRHLADGTVDTGGRVTESRVTRPRNADPKGSRISPALLMTEMNGEGRCSGPEVNDLGRNVTNNFCCLRNFFLLQETRRKIFFFLNNESFYCF